MASIQKNPQEFVILVENLSVLYLKVKERVLLAETFNGAVILDTINELRNAFDHVMRATQNPDFELAKIEFSKAEAHLYRVSYDSYEIVAIYVLEEVDKLLKPYPGDLINIVLPDYYSKIRPRLSELKINLAKCRKDKLDTATGEHLFEDYENVVAELLAILSKIEQSIPELIRNEKIKKQANLKWFIITPILIGVILIFAGWGFNKIIANPTNKEKIETQNNIGDTSIVKIDSSSNVKIDSFPKSTK